MHQAAGELVDNDDLPGLHQVVLVALEEDFRAQSLLQVADQTRLLGCNVLRPVRVSQGQAEDLLGVLLAHLGQRHCAIAFVDLVIVGTELAHRLGHTLVFQGIFRGWAGDDERRACLVDKDVIHLVDDGEIADALHTLLAAQGQVVAQVVEAEFVVGAVGDIGGVGLAPIDQPQLVDIFLRGAAFCVVNKRLARVVGARRLLQHAHGQPEQRVDWPHPPRVTARQVVVDCDQARAAPLERIEVQRERGDERLALAGAHLGHPPLVQDHAADELHVEVTQAEGALRGLPHRSKGLRQKGLQVLALSQARAELSRLGAQRLVGQPVIPGLQCVDLRNQLAVFLDVAAIGIAADQADKRPEHGWRDGLP